MIPYDHSRARVNPRKLVVEGRERELWHLMQGYGYVPQELVFRDFIQSLKSGLPWMIGGLRGCGKSTFCDALAASCNLSFFSIVGREGIGTEEILYQWDEKEQEVWMEEARRRGIPYDQASKEKWTKKYLILGEVAAAYEAAEIDEISPLLFLDEADKFGARTEDKLLQPLASGLIYVPRLWPVGYIGCRNESRWPIVVTATNDLRYELTAPFKSRHLYTWIDMPSMKEEVRIILAHVPEVPWHLLSSVIKFLNSVRVVPGIEDPPSIRESVRFLNALWRDGVKDVTPEVLKSYLCYLARSKDDRDQLTINLDYLSLCASAPHDELDAFVDEAISERRRVLKRAA